MVFIPIDLFLGHPTFEPRAVFLWPPELACFSSQLIPEVGVGDGNQLLHTLALRLAPQVGEYSRGLGNRDYPDFRGIAGIRGFLRNAWKSRI